MNKKTLCIFFSIVLLAMVAIPACKLYYKNEAKAYSVQTSPQLIKEGKHLTLLMCGPCHYDAHTKQLSGERMMDVPRFVGKVYASNITQHKEMGIGNYTDAELAYLMRTGIAKNGKLMPYMQRPNLADRDLRAIIAFLRSDDPLVKASDKNPGKTKCTPIGKMGISMSGSLPDTQKEISAPTEKIAQGKYLIDNLACYDCHSSSFIGIDKITPEKSKGYMKGGNKLKDKSGKTVRSSNLTPHETGIGSWSEADFRRAMKEGISKDRSVIAYPMPYYEDLTDEEISAIYAYLKTLTPEDNKIKKR